MDTTTYSGEDPRSYKEFILPDMGEGKTRLESVTDLLKDVIGEMAYLDTLYDRDQKEISLEEYEAEIQMGCIFAWCEMKKKNLLKYGPHSSK